MLKERERETIMKYRKDRPYVRTEESRRKKNKKQKTIAIDVCKYS
jgi:hypothetical protein